MLLKARPGDFFDEWETIPNDERLARHRALLAAYIAFARQHSPFYIERLEAFDPKAAHPLARVPLLESADLRANLPPQGSSLLTSSEGGWTVFQSGGNTGMPKSSLFGHDEMERLTFANARGFQAVGLRPEDRVANFWAVGGLYMTFVHMNRFLQMSGCQSFPFANNTPTDFVHTVAKLYDVNVFSGISSIVLKNLRAMKELGLDGIRIKKVFFGGEHLYDADLRELKDVYGVETIKAPGYGTVDSWYIGYQCAHTPLGTFHTHDDQTHVEIVNEDDGKHCAPGDVGMLYATAFPRKLTPIVRYRVGDRARWLKDPCVCGRTTPLFQLLGRGDDVLRVGYDSVEYEAVQKLVLSIEGLSGSVQMEKQRRDGRDELIIRIESSASDRKGLAAKFEEALLSDRPTLRGFVEKGSIWPLKIEIHPLDALPRNPRTGKLIRVVDAIKE